MLSCLFIAALWSSGGKGLTSWLSFVMFNCVFVTFPFGILGQVWHLIVSIPDLCTFLTWRQGCKSYVVFKISTAVCDETSIIPPSTNPISVLIRPAVLDKK